MGRVTTVDVEGESLKNDALKATTRLRIYLDRDHSRILIGVTLPCSNALVPTFMDLSETSLPSQLYVWNPGGIPRKPSTKPSSTIAVFTALRAAPLLSTSML